MVDKVRHGGGGSRQDEGAHQDDPAECWIAWEDAMSRYQAHQDLTLGLLMDCWDQASSLTDPSLDPPGREEAIKRAIQRS